MRVLEPKEIVRLLRAEVKKAGSQEAWAKKAGLQRTLVNKVLRGKRQPTESIILALGLRIVVVSN
jgi:DNA-binding phage protein